MMITFIALTAFVEIGFGESLVQVLQNDGVTTLLALVRQAGLADVLVSGILLLYC